MRVRMRACVCVRVLEQSVPIPAAGGHTGRYALLCPSQVDREHLFRITCYDMIERFQLVLFLIIVNLQARPHGNGMGSR
jgi:hypothetical protein